MKLFPLFPSSNDKPTFVGTSSLEQSLLPSHISTVTDEQFKLIKGKFKL